MTQEQNMPSLVPISKRKIDNKQVFFSKEDLKEIEISPQINPSQRTDPKANTQFRPKDNKQEDKLKPKQQLQNVKVEQFQKKFRQKAGMARKDQKLATNNKKNQENQRSKMLITEMLSKVAAKNMSQQLFPVSSEFIDNLLAEIQTQIKQLENQAEKKSNTLQNNPNNQRLKKQIQDIQKSINQCATIKELYYDKINSRNKIKILQEKLHQLRSQNRDLKIKISKGIEKINGHMHNLPCEREKQLQQQLNKSSTQREQEKEMRIKLEKNIEEITLNFKRLYEEADDARLIVINKLKQVQQRQRRIQALQKIYNQDQNQQSIKRSGAIDPPYKKNIPEKQRSNQITQSKKMSYSGLNNNEETVGKKNYGNAQKGVKKNKYTLNQQVQVEEFKFTIEDQIKKMRNNRFNLLKATQK